MKRNRPKVSGLRALITLLTPSMTAAWPLLLGICVGLGFKLIRPMSMCDLPVLEPDTRVQRDVQPESGVINEPVGIDSAPVLTHEHSPGAKVDNNPNGRVFRHRYVNTELRIKDKLMVGVLSSRDTIHELAVTLNRTLAQHVTKLVFFMDARSASLPTDMGIVSFTDHRPHLKPIHMLRYVLEHYKSVFDYYYFITDSTYVRGEKLFKYVSSLSISGNYMIGTPGITESGEQTGYCHVGAGIILSQTYLERLEPWLEWCSNNAHSHDHAVTLGQCLQAALKVQCQTHAQGVPYHHYHSRDFSYEDISSLRYKDAFNKVISVYRVSTAEDQIQLHRYFVGMQLNSTQDRIRELRSEIQKTAPLALQTRDVNSWPAGTNAQFSTFKTRYNVINWVYFTESHIYIEDEVSNIEELKGVNKLDVQEIVGEAMSELRAKYKQRYTLNKLLAGYRRFDPTRGMDYILDLELQDKEQRQLVIQRMQLLKPLSLVEVIPMPYVTESSHINLVLPVTSQEIGGVASFLDSFSHTCLDTGDSSQLYIVFISEPQSDAAKDRKQTESADAFALLKSMIAYYERKYQQGAHIAWTTLEAVNPSQTAIAETVSKKFAPESLMLLCTVGMELEIDLLNRVRMNTIAGWQIFFPVAFWHYRPNLVYEKKPFPSTIDIKADVGHYDQYVYEHVSFYNSDLGAAREAATVQGEEVPPDLLGLFLHHSDLHVFRAVEPSLKLRYKERQCTASLPADLLRFCEVSRLRGLASRTQLARLVLAQRAQETAEVANDTIDKEEVEEPPLGGVMQDSPDDETEEEDVNDNDHA